MKTPFITQNAIVFECRSGALCVGDLINPPACFALSLKGICHLPASAIIPAKNAPSSFSVDNAQIFFIDADHYDEIAAAVSGNGTIEPNLELYTSLRARHRTQFGYVVASDLYDSVFDGNGNYSLDMSQVRGGLPSIEEPTPDARELLRRLIWSMNTLVCASCFTAGFDDHPELGGTPFGYGNKKKVWSLAMADHAIALGWTAIPEQGSFGEITSLCPKCQLQRGS